MANPNIEAAYFWIQRNGSKYKGLGSNLSEKMVADDLVWVQRGSDKFYAKYDGSNSWPTIRDTDWVWAQGEDGQHYKVSGENFKALFVPPETFGVRLISGTLKVSIENSGTSAIPVILKSNENDPGTKVAQFSPGRSDFTSGTPGTYTWRSDKMTSLRFWESDRQVQFTIEPGSYVGSCRSLENCFKNCERFNSDISDWDVSNVNKLSSFADRAYAFNQDISSWDVSKVTNMWYAFAYAREFNQPLGEWNVSNVTNMGSTFNGASKFNQDLSNWNTSKVTDFQSTFRGASAFNRNISSWDVSKSRRLDNMFNAASKFNQNIGSWNVSNVTRMNSMFSSAANFNWNIGGWDTSKVTNMSYMFNVASKFNQNLSGWCVSGVSSKPPNFDSGSGFQNQTSRQPQWGTCP